MSGEMIPARRREVANARSRRVQRSAPGRRRRERPEVGIVRPRRLPAVSADPVRHERALGPVHRLLPLLVHLVPLRHQAAEGRLRMRPTRQAARRRGRDVVSMRGSHHRRHRPPRPGICTSPPGPAAAMQLTELRYHTGVVCDGLFLGAQFVLQIADGLFVLQLLRVYSLLQVRILRLQRLVGARRPHHPASVAVGFNQELLEEELGRLFRYIDLVYERLAKIREREVPAATLSREERLHARLLDVRRLCSDDQFCEVVLSQPCYWITEPIMNY